MKASQRHGVDYDANCESVCFGSYESLLIVGDVIVTSNYAIKCPN